MCARRSDRLDFPPFHVLPDVDLLYRGDEIVTLQPRAVQLLRYLAEHHKRAVSKAELLAKVWDNAFTSDAVIKQAIAQVRRALGDDVHHARYIETFHSRGYQFIGRVRRSAPPAPGADIQMSVPDPDYDQLVGRELEFDLLCSEYRRTLEAQTQPLLVTGEPGAGKTQLARRFGKWAQDQGALTLYARFFDYGASQLAPYEIFLGLLRTALECTDLREAVRERVRVELPEELFAASDISLAGRIRAFSADQSRVISPIAQSFDRLSLERPIVLIFDDLQWADDASQSCLEYMIRTASTNRLMILGLARSVEIAQTSDTSAGWLEGPVAKSSFTVLALKPLDESNCARAIEAIFGGPATAPDVPVDDLRMLRDVTGGNPYFLTEMLRLLQAEGAIDRRGAPEERWQWSGIRDLHLPATLMLMSQTKLERLSPETREVLEHAAVIGDEFRMDTICLTAARGATEIQFAIDEGLRSGVLSIKGLSSGEDCRFYHNVLRRTLYESLPMRKRRRLHAQTARSLQTVYADKADRVAAAISSQFEAAGDTKQTFEWGMRAWKAARSRWQWREAAAAIERAWRAVQAMDAASGETISPQQRIDCLLGLGETYGAIGRMKDSEAALVTALALAETLGDRARTAGSLLSLSQTRFGRAHYSETIAPAERALEIYGEIGDEEGVSLALLHLSNARVAMGDYGQAATLLEMMLQVVEPDSLAANIAYGILGWARVREGRIAEGIPLIEKAIAAHRLELNLREISRLELRLHWAYFRQGDYESALRLALQSRSGFSQTGDLPGVAKANIGFGQVRIAEGMLAEGRQIVAAALRELQRSGDSHSEAEALWILGKADAANHDVENARKNFDRALELVRAIGDRDDEFRILLDVAALESKSGNPQAGLCTSDEALRIARELGNSEGM